VRRVLLAAVLVGTGLAAAAWPASAATNECRGLQICVPIAGPWVVVPATSSIPGRRVEYQLSCPSGYIVGGLDAELSDRRIDIGFLALVGSPVNPGVSTKRAVVFYATFVGAQPRLSSFRPHIGCIPSAGGGQRTPTVARAVPPGTPTVRRVQTVNLLAGRTQHVAATCGRGERLVQATHAVGFYTPGPPTPALVARVKTREAVGANRIAVTVSSATSLGTARAEVQAEAVCAGGR
jgi:hypothetical protein